MVERSLSIMDKEFETRRYNALHELYDMEGDRSRKGSVDAPVQDLVDLINNHPHMFTTSCCSGRISCFAEPTEETRAAGKKGGEWVYVSHDPVDADEVLSKIATASAGGSCLVFRMEPFVMHCECRSVEWSGVLLGLARQAGFRESGMVPSSRGRYMVGLRCNLRLEIPVADNGLLVTNDYIRYIVATANNKLKLNETRHLRLLDLIKEMPQQLKETRAQGRSRAHRRTCHKQHARATAHHDILSARIAQLSMRQEGLLDRLSVVEATGYGQTVPLKRHATAKTGKPARRRPARSRRPHAAGRPASGGSSDTGWVLLLSKSSVKPVKDAIKGAGWLDTGRRAGEQAGGLIGLPIDEELALKLQAAEHESLPFPASIKEDLRGAKLVQAHLTATKRQTPAQTLRKNVTHLLESELGDPAMASRLAAELPAKWERLGDLVLLPAGSCEGGGWEQLPQKLLWETAAHSLSAKRIARQARIANKGTR